MNHGKLIANIVQPLEREIFLAEVYWQNGHIIAINKRGDEDSRSTYLIPGFIDAHIHIESSMLAPSEFARIACRHGTVATVSDPHEIANVLGLDGIAFMVDNARLTPFQIFLAHHPVSLQRPLKLPVPSSKVNNWSFCLKIKSQPIYQK